MIRSPCSVVSVEEELEDIEGQSSCISLDKREVEDTGVDFPTLPVFGAAEKSWSIYEGKRGRMARVRETQSRGE